MQKSAACSERSTPVHERPGIGASILIGIVYLYQYTLSPIFGNACRYMPSCSHYAQDALRMHGAWRGSALAAKRVLRCHPWHEGGYDPVPVDLDKPKNGNQL